MWTFICVFKLPISVTNFVHSLQGCSFSPVCTLPKCSFKWQSCAKVFGHWLQRNEFFTCIFKLFYVWNPLDIDYTDMVSHLCVFSSVFQKISRVKSFKCLLKWAICENTFGHLLQLYGLSPVWVHRCIFKLYFEKVLGHCLQGNNLYKLITREWIIQGWPITSMDSWITIKIILLWEKFGPWLQLYSFHQVHACMFL